MVVATHILAQDIDTVVFPHSRKPFTFLDQIEDERERSGFLRLYREKQPGEKRRQAEEFLQTWPQSWLLALVSEIACKASIDLDDHPAAIQYGKLSLRLYPENPLLLVPLANVQVKAKLYADAARNARDALDYLDRFGRPASIKEDDWTALQPQLKASSYYVLGRVTASQGLVAQGNAQKTQLRAAVQHLTRARQLNAEDPEIAYLLGLVELSLGDADAAAGQFAAAASAPGPLQAQALEYLRKMPRRAPVIAEASPAPREPPPAASSRLPQYAGSQACRSCHSGQHSAWEQTGMARMFRPYRPENVIGDFQKQTQFEGDSGRPLARMWTERDRHYFATKGPGGQWQTYPVDFTIGSKWQQAYATRLANGQIQVFPLQYSRLEKTWLNYWKVIDPPGSERADVDGFHRMGPGANYQMNCAPCHTSQLGATKTDHTEPQDLTFREAGINCEMCHGPSGSHVSAMRDGKSYARRAIDPPVDFRKLDHREYVEICAQCHMQSAMRDLGPHGEWNYAAEGNSFVRHYPSRPFVEFSHRAFYKDGRFRETTFIVEALMRSACYRRGQAHCGNCHDPHPVDAAVNPTSLKYRVRPDQMCLQCHTRYAAHIGAHTHHAAASEGSRCLNCHMPRIMNSVLFLARSHQIDDIPAAGMTLRFGQRESPNACLFCHREKDSHWVAERLQSW